MKCSTGGSHQLAVKQEKEREGGVRKEETNPLLFTGNLVIYSETQRKIQIN